MLERTSEQKENNDEYSENEITVWQSYWRKSTLSSQ